MKVIHFYTINPEIAHGISKHIGSIENGKRADLVIWDPAFFGVKPEMVLIGGSIACSQMGDPNASIPTPQPIYTRILCSRQEGEGPKASFPFLPRASIKW